MNIFGLEIKRKASTPESCNNQVRTPTQRVIQIADYSSLFYPKVIDFNFVSLFHDIIEIQQPINLIVDRCLNAKITLKDYKNDADIWSNDKINKFLEQPNPLYSFNEFFTAFLNYYLVTGNTYMVSDIPGFKTTELWKYADNYYILPAQNVDVKLLNQGMIPPFSYTTASEVIKSYDITYNGQYLSFSPESILHVKEANLKFDKDTFKGKSKLSGCKNPISNLIAQYEARNIIFVKRGALGAIVSKDKDDSGAVPLLESEKKMLRDGMNTDFGVTEGRDPLMIVDRDIDFVRFNLSIQELQPYDEYLSDVIAIASAYSIPRDMAINKDKSTYANQGGSEKSLYENVVIPLTNKFIKAVSNWMGLTNSGLYLNADFSHIPCLQVNKKEEATTFKFNSESYSKLYNENTITYNEMRIGLGYEAVTGMDKYKNEIDNGKDREQDIQN